MVRHCSNAVKRQQRVDSVQGAKEVNGYDPHDLNRFEEAQANRYQMALSETRDRPQWPLPPSNSASCEERRSSRTWGAEITRRLVQ